MNTQTHLNVNGRKVSIADLEGRYGTPPTFDMNNWWDKVDDMSDKEYDELSAYDDYVNGLRKSDSWNQMIAQNKASQKQLDADLGSGIDGILGQTS